MAKTKKTKKTLPLASITSAGDLTIRCFQGCGLPITKTSHDFGMDCANDCSRKAYEAQHGTRDPFANLEDELMGMIAMLRKM